MQASVFADGDGERAGLVFAEQVEDVDAELVNLDVACSVGLVRVRTQADCVIADEFGLGREDRFFSSHFLCPCLKFLAEPDVSRSQNRSDRQYRQDKNQQKDIFVFVFCHFCLLSTITVSLASFSTTALSPSATML